MRPPPFLIGAALAFWGWQTDLMIWALPLALLVESSQYIRARWEFANADLNRIFDVCVLLGVGVGLILYSSETRLEFFFKWIQSMPFFFVPILLAQVFGSRERMPLSVFSWVLRRTPDRPLAQKSFNISWLYFAVCLMAASGNNGDSPVFYFGIVLLVALALASVRPARLALPFWMVLVALAAVGGYFGQRFLRAGQANLEVAIGNWLAKSTWRKQLDAREARTAIGHVSRLKLSGRIVLRVRPEPGSPPPTLLREASFLSYRRGIWNSGDNQFERAFVDTNDTVILSPNARPKFAAHIAGYLDNGKGLLALPAGVSELRELPVLLETNRLGVARADGGPGFVNYLARYNPDTPLDPPPGDSDLELEVPPAEKPAVEKIAAELHLKSKSESEKLEAIATFFQQKFQYSLEGHRSKPGRSPIEQFLTETRSGHCEYFASATVLLLREAGLRARYAIGYVVPDSGRHGDTWYVRERHGHAWAMVYREDRHRWEELDTTPPSRDQIEESRASMLEGISDFGSGVWFQFSKWRWSKTDYTRYLPWLLIPLIVFLLWRIFHGKRRRHTVKDLAAPSKEPVWPGFDSELYLINRHVAVELHRQPDEPLLEWQQRLSLYQSDRLNRVFHLHRRFRFDPEGLTDDDRKVLKNEVEIWLAEFESKRKAQPNL